MLTIESRQFFKSGEFKESTRVMDLILEKIMKAEPLSQKKLKRIRGRKKQK